TRRSNQRGHVAKKKAQESYPLERVRNIGIVAHVDAGKTTTTEQINYYTGAMHRIGTVDDGNTVTDYMAQEQERGITIVSANVTVHWTPATGVQHRINLIDTPGHIDFTAEVERALRVLDGAVGVFCGVAGVQAQSSTVWRQAGTYGVPRIAYVNKLDRTGANFYDVLTDLKERLEMLPIPVQIPIGEEKDFNGIVDLITQRAWTWDDGDPPPPPVEGDVPEEVQDEVALYREQMIERIAELDDEVATAFLEERELTPELLRAGLRRITIACKGYPVLCGSSFKHKGVQPLLDAVCHYLPAPTDRPPIEGRAPKGKGKRRKDDDQDAWEPASRAPSLDEPFCALAFKTVSSKTNDLTYLRIYSGTADRSCQLLNPRTGKKERLGGGIYRLTANRKEPLDEASVGDMVGVVGLRYTRTGDTLCDAQSPILLETIGFPFPVVSRAVEPKSTKDKDDLRLALERLSKDDPTLTVSFPEDNDSGQTVISGMGELHLEVVTRRLQDDWKVEAKVGKPRVSYKQTVAGPGKGSFVYDREQGDKRVFAGIDLEVTPTPKAGKLSVVFACPADLVPADYQLAIEDALRAKASGVGDWGDPLIDVQIKVVGGKYEPELSNEAAFCAAASFALEKALEDAGLISLEPVMTLTVETPEDMLGNVQQDLQMRRAQILSMSPVKDRLRVVAAVPMAETFGYSSDIRSRTGGQADFTLEPREYEVVPEGKRPKLF
ncbi:MAG: elongation factor G, partial [Planctomycetes bacterium]|nr:elongation factor G [Planctomycetota bacterium]